MEADKKNTSYKEALNVIKQLSPGIYSRMLSTQFISDYSEIERLRAILVGHVGVDKEKELFNTIREQAYSQLAPNGAYIILKLQEECEKVNKPVNPIKMKPILFSTPMVKAILEGRKTQTRRIVKQQPPANCVDEEPLIDFDYSFKGTNENPAWYTEWEMNLNPGDSSVYSHCVYSPFGKIGDILWVRETFTEWPKGSFQYKASTVNGEEFGKWKPSIHMPTDAARIFLVITNVRIERLRDISNEDAVNEGILLPIDGCHHTQPKRWFNYLRGVYQGLGFGPIDSFHTLWDSINGPESWNENPWVWVYDFNVLSTQGIDF